jgi:hypothetical protein
VPQGIKRTSKKERLRELAELNGWGVIGEVEWAAITAAIPKVKTEDLRAAGLAAEAPWSGVRQHTLEELEVSLLAMTRVYETQAHLSQFCRSEVIRAKDLARILSRSNPAKAEMVEWMLVWLSDPALSPAWIEIRKRIIDTQ